MSLKARAMTEKYTRPEPSEELYQALEPDVPVVWRWAEAQERIDILAPLARVVSRFLKSKTSDHYEIKRSLHEWAEQAKSANHYGDYAQFLLALAELENDPATQLGWYEETLEIFTQLGDWVAEANSASLAGHIHLQQREFDQARQLYLRSYKLWSQAKNINGMGITLIHLSGILESTDRYIEACRLLYKARKLLFNRSMWTITARDLMNRLAYEQKIPLEMIETKKTADELVTEIFGWSLGYIK